MAHHLQGLLNYWDIAFEIVESWDIVYARHNLISMLHVHLMISNAHLGGLTRKDHNDFILGN